MTELAISYQDAGQIDEAIALEEAALQLKRQHLPPGHSYTLESLKWLARYYDKTNRKPEADGLRREAAELKAKNKGN